MKNIVENKNNIVKDIYTLNQITRLIHGKQFEFINNYLMENENIDFIKYNILNMLQIILLITEL